jgi:hypothetical protein
MLADSRQSPLHTQDTRHLRLCWFLAPEGDTIQGFYFFFLFGSFLDRNMSENDASLVSSLQSALATHISLFGKVADKAIHKTQSLP